MSSESNSEFAPDNWWLHRRTDDDHFVFAYEFSKSVLCHVQQSSDWLVRLDRADGTILFSQHDLRSQAAAFDLAESVMELCTLLHREVVTERSQARKPMYVGPRPTRRASARLDEFVSECKPWPDLESPLTIIFNTRGNQPSMVSIWPISKVIKYIKSQTDRLRWKYSNCGSYDGKPLGSGQVKCNNCGTIDEASSFPKNE
jgi:hypothetical protein